MFTHCSQVFGRPITRWSSPEDTERFVEHRKVLGSSDQQAAESVVEVGSSADIDVTERTDDIHCADRLNLEADGAEETGKMQEIPEESRHRRTGD